MFEGCHIIIVMIKLIINSINIYQMLTIYFKHFTCVISFSAHNNPKHYANLQIGKLRLKEGSHLPRSETEDNAIILLGDHQ